MKAIRWTLVVAGCVLVVGSSTAFAQAPAAPAAPQPTLWSFLGIPQSAKKMNDNLLNRRGNHPGLEKKPPLKKLADPENLKSPNPAIKKAAEIKQQEDLAKQKIKAIKYLASIGCGCYNLDGSITEALLAAMTDCTESVRLAAVEAIGEAADGEMCVNCKQKSCCSKEITEKLAEIAYERDDNGCWKEPSERVREAAAEALRSCCPGYEPAEEIREVPRESPDQPLQDPASKEATSGGDSPIDPPTIIRRPTAEPSAALPQSSRRTSMLVSAESSSTLATLSDATPGLAPVVDRTIARQGLGQAASGSRQLVSDPTPAARTSSPRVIGLPDEAAVKMVVVNKGLVEVTCDATVVMPKGTRLKVYHHYLLTGPSLVGELEVVEAYPGAAITRPFGSSRINKIAAGDRVEPVR